jgi:hypothetical protein
VYSGIVRNKRGTTKVIFFDKNKKYDLALAEVEECKFRKLVSMASRETSGWHTIPLLSKTFTLALSYATNCYEPRPPIHIHELNLTPNPHLRSS